MTEKALCPSPGMPPAEMGRLGRRDRPPAPPATAAAPPAEAPPTTTPAFHALAPDPACPHCRDSAAEGAPDWSFVDAVYCISLAERADRAALAAAELHAAGLCRRVLFHRPTRHPTRIIEGIWEAHRSVARHALAAGARTALILEDDVKFTRRPTAARVARVAAAMDRLPPGWSIFFLGHWPLKARFRAVDTLETWSACAHAYIANRALLDWLDAHPFAARAQDYEKRAGGGIDAAYARLPGCFAYFPMLAIQAVRGSDHMAAKKRRKKVRRLKHLVTRTSLGEFLLSRLMRANELTIAAIGLVAGGGQWLGRRRPR